MKGQYISSLVLCASALLSSININANDLNISPATCQPPIINQAFPLRWHQNYLMNPPTNTKDAWVICPLNFDNDILPSVFVVGVLGAVASGAATYLPTCLVTSYSTVNLSLPPFINGPALKIASNLQIQKLDSEKRLWLGGVGVAKSNLVSAFGDLDLVAASLMCKLPPGYAISAIVLGDDY